MGDSIHSELELPQSCRRFGVETYSVVTRRVVERLSATEYTSLRLRSFVWCLPVYPSFLLKIIPSLGTVSLSSIFHFQNLCGTLCILFVFFLNLWIGSALLVSVFYYSNIQYQSARMFLIFHDRSFRANIHRQLSSPGFVFAGERLLRAHLVTGRMGNDLFSNLFFCMLSWTVRAPVVWSPAFSMIFFFSGRVQRLCVFCTSNPS